MSIAAIIADMVRAGVDPDLIGRAAEAMAAREASNPPTEKRSKAAERQARYRARKHNDGATIATSDVTTVTPDLLEEKGFPIPLPKTQTSKPSEPKGSSGKLPAHVRAADFDRFWEAYPRKVAKPDARKAFDRAIAKITDPDPLGVILGGLELAKPGWTEPKFTPHPASWLNAERWTDEHQPEGNQNGPVPRNSTPGFGGRNSPDDIRRNAAAGAVEALARRGQLPGGGAPYRDQSDPRGPTVERPLRD